ncbi:hypothetical protein DFH07DRAFT_947192 [Mycena maculata]|uniref:Uncharacterized protein n=1 Tax=Mycena maculata TaxID=230809 RepID=A0AAD7HFN6_9AGAR|nr:hypothetical protein DFH07DRAFT_947192 [Mycena maculata]
MLHHRDDLSVSTIPDIPGSSCRTGALTTSTSSLDSSLLSSSTSFTPLRERCGFNLTIQIVPPPVTIAAKGHLEPHVSNLPRRRRKALDIKPEPLNGKFSVAEEK